MSFEASSRRGDSFPLRKTKSSLRYVLVQHVLQDIFRIFSMFIRFAAINNVGVLSLHIQYAGSGVVLADEMGLGKSVQTISLIISMIKEKTKNRGPPEKYLLIVPSSLVRNWQCEFLKWVPHSRVLVGYFQTLFVSILFILLW